MRGLPRPTGGPPPCTPWERGPAPFCIGREEYDGERGVPLDPPCCGGRIEWGTKVLGYE
jgi:hypothetical protein